MIFVRRGGWLLVWLSACTFGTGSGSPSDLDPDDTGTTASPVDDDGGPDGVLTSSGNSGEASVTPDDGDSTSDRSSTSAGASEGSDAGSGDSSTGAASQLCDPDDPNLVACWDFAGGDIVDQSMFGNHGVAMGVTVVPGPFGDAVRTGPRASISIPDSVSLDVTAAVSVEAWVNLDALPPTGRRGILDDDGQYGVMVFADGTFGCLGGAASVFGGPVPLGRWIVVSCVHDEDTWSLAIDGDTIAKIDSAGPLTSAAATPTAIGDSSPEFIEPLDGAIGGLRIWRVALERGDIGRLP